MVRLPCLGEHVAMVTVNFVDVSRQEHAVTPLVLVNLRSPIRSFFLSLHHVIGCRGRGSCSSFVMICNNFTDP